MGHFEDDANHKIPHKEKTDCQNQLKTLVLVSFKILYGIRYKKIDVILVQCPFNTKQTRRRVKSKIEGLISLLITHTSRLNCILLPWFSRVNSF